MFMGGKDTIDNWDARLLEYPFVYKGMTEEAYFEEKKYYGENFDKVMSGEYMPLWKQRAGISAVEK